MKDLPHHMKKLNRRIVRSAHREEVGEEIYDLEMPVLLPRQQSVKAAKKQAKIKMRKERTSRTPTPLTPDERERKMSHRVPVFDRTNNAKPKVARPTRKKTPRI